jgi:hypothetical protein
MKILTELNEEIQVITEGEGASKKLYLEGIIMQGDIANKNKRCYPMKVLRPEVERYVREYVDQNRAVGELGHPSGPTVNPDKVSHRFLSLKEDNKNYVGKALVLDTPNGMTTQKLIEGGVKVGMSSRALGSLKMNDKGINEVQGDLMLSTAGDIVLDPSAPDAFVQGIMENVEWIFSGGQWTYQKLEETQELIRSTKSKQLEDVMIRLFDEYINGISK